MKRTFTFCTLVLGIILLFSCVSAAPQSVPEQGGSSVWKINRNGNNLFLGGSIHLLREEDYPLPMEFDLAFSQSTALVLEADIRQMEKAEFQEYFMRQLLLSEGQTLETLLDSETLEMLAAILNEYGIPIEYVSFYKPSALITMLNNLLYDELGFTEEGVDLCYLSQAENEDKPVYFLETAESQIFLIASAGEGYENDYVKYTLLDFENTEMFLSTTVNEWKIGDRAGIETMLKEMKEKWPLIYKAQITDRHNAWVPQIEEFLDSGSTFFVLVGLAHIHGTDGLLQLLKDRDCTIEQFR